jgi:hypothetical protein
MNIENGKLSLWNDADKKPYVCIDADGDHLSLPTGILHDCRLSDPCRIRRAKFNRWMNKHPRLTGGIGLLGCAVIAIALIGYAALCIHTMSQSEPVPPMTQNGIAVQEQFSNLSENDQSQIVQDWQDAQPVDQPDREYGYPY